MSQIPLDMDHMMWDIADRRDTEAAAEFCQRFPALAQDMESRMAMVAGMKGMRQAIAPAFVPRFTARQAAPQTNRKWLRYSPAALALAALAGASYYVTQNILTPLPDPSVFKPPVVEQHEAKIEQVRPKPKPTPAPADFESDAPTPFHDHNRDASDTSGNDGSDISDNAQTLKFSYTPLKTAVHSVADTFGKKLEMPKTFPNPVINETISGSSAMVCFSELGQEFGFTAYDEGDNTILLVPARGR